MAEPVHATDVKGFFIIALAAAVAALIVLPLVDWVFNKAAAVVGGQILAKAA